MNESLDNLCWPVSRLAEAIEELALSARLLDKRSDARAEHTPLTDEELESKDSRLVGRLVEAAAEWM